MKLFLSSLGVSDELRPTFLALVGKDAADIHLAHVENAADPLPEERRGFLAARREELARLVCHYERLDLRDYIGQPAELRARLLDCDAVFVGGGNVFYLRHLLRETGFDQIIRSVMERGVVYGGGSAGSIVIGPTLSGFEAVDDPSLPPVHIQEGVGLVDFAPIPHWGHHALQERLIAIRDQLYGLGVKAVAIRDGQGRSRRRGVMESRAAAGHRVRIPVKIAMKTAIKITILSCSLADDSKSRRLAEAAAQFLAARQVEVRLVDCRSLGLPDFDHGACYESPAVRQLTADLAWAEGIVLAMPIYNWGGNSVAKKVIEATGADETGRRVRGLGGQGGDVPLRGGSSAELHGVPAARQRPDARLQVRHQPARVLRGRGRTSARGIGLTKKRLRGWSGRCRWPSS